MEKPKQSPARYIRQQSTADLKRIQTAMKKLSDPMGPVDVFKFFKGIPAEGREQFSKSQTTSKTLLPLVNAELKKRSGSSLIKGRSDGS